MDTYQQKLSHLKALYHLAHADNEISPIEITYIRKVAEHLGVDPKEIESFNGAEPVMELPDKQYKVYSVFHRLAILIMVDDQVSASEKQYCFNLGIKMGLHPNAVTEIIDHIHKKGAMNALPSEIMAIFKKIHELILDVGSWILDFRIGSCRSNARGPFRELKGVRLDSGCSILDA